MIVGSLLLILVAVTLLVVGLADGSSTLLATSIAASLLAAVALVVGARQATTTTTSAAGDVPTTPQLPTQQTARIDTDDAGRRQPPGSAVSGILASGLADSLIDEPPVQVVASEEVAQVALLDAEVFVIDNRPRYHLADCPHLEGRVSESVPVAEAMEHGFTPCGRCAPITTLLIRAGLA